MLLLLEPFVTLDRPMLLEIFIRYYFEVFISILSLAMQTFFKNHRFRSFQIRAVLILKKIFGLGPNGQKRKSGKAFVLKVVTHRSEGSALSWKPNGRNSPTEQTIRFCIAIASLGLG